MNIEKTDTANGIDTYLSLEELKTAARANAKLFYDRQTETSRNVESGKAKAISLSHQLELIKSSNAIESQKQMEFDLTLSAVRYVIDMDNAIRSLDKNAGHLVNTVFLENLWEKIFGYACSMTYEDYMTFFESFLAEYNKLKGANK